MGMEKIGVNICKEILAWTKTGSNGLLATKPVKINTCGLTYTPNVVDSVCFTNPIAAINTLLKSNYGIKSEIINPDIGQKVLSTVEDFVKINKNNKLFKDLTIKQGVFNEGIATISANSKTNEFVLTFNNNFDWKNIKNITKQMYNEGKIPSDNPACLLYKEFGEFLNFQYNPYAYIYTMDRTFTGDSVLNALRISNSTNVSDFNAHYIAGRMSRKNYPKILRTYFEENGGNLNLRFPKSENFKIVQGSVHHFKSAQDSAKYLSEKYGITAEFINKEQANHFAGAVDDLVKLTDNPHIFKGLKIRIAPENFNDTLTHMSLNWDYATGKAELLINPAYNWNVCKKSCLNDYQKGHHPGINLKGTYIHELAHYLDFKGNPIEFGKTEKAFGCGQTYYNNYGKSITAKVSNYATESPAEFHSEYIVGRFNGIEYPEATNKEFVTTWHGPTLKF